MAEAATRTAEQHTGTVARRLAGWVSALRYDDLPPEVVDQAKLLILDQLGVQVRGATLPNTQPVRRLAQSEPTTPQSTVTLGGTKASATQAAYVNGTLGHSCEYDDAHMLAWHTGSAVVPPALAFAERADADGRDLITAVVAGVQVMSLLGAVAGPGMVAAGWHGSKVLGVFGAAAAAGTILHLTADQLVDAFGIAASDAGGTMKYDQSGGEVKRLHAGSAARSGSEAALLARLGLTGPPTIFEGNRGVLRLFGGAGRPQALDDDWDRWHVLDTIFRFYPAVATVHSPLDAVRHLRGRHAIDWRQIEQIRVGLVDYAVGHGGSITRPTDPISAQFSLAFGMGLQFTTGGNAPRDYFDPHIWSDPDILRIGGLIEPYAMAIPAGDPDLSSRVEITLRDSRRFERYQAGFRGHPATPATRADIEGKFRDNVADVITEQVADGILDAVAAIDAGGVGGVPALTALLGAGQAG